MDVLMTACRRPEIVHRTLQSFASALNNYEGHRLFINIDPVGGFLKDSDEVISVCNSYFDDVKTHTPVKSSFPNAFNWCWEKAESDIVFMLEDDWELIKDIDTQKILDILTSEPDLAILRLPMFRSTETEMKNWNKFFPWNGKYFECPEDQRGCVGFCGHPSFIKKEFVENCLPLIDNTLNPEKQFHRRGSKLLDEVLKWRYGVYSTPNSGPAIRDIGRPWIQKTNWVKKGNKAHFTEWHKEIKE